jgi:hypothetical protein
MQQEKMKHSGNGLHSGGAGHHILKRSKPPTLYFQFLNFSF